MTAPNREAVEAAEAVWRIGNRHGPDAERKREIAEYLAALPFLAPQPSVSDEERARDLSSVGCGCSEDEAEHCPDMDGCCRRPARFIALALAAVRAEATLFAADAAKDAQIAALREALEAIEPYQDAGGHWCVRCGASLWTMPDQTEAERVASVRRAALEMSGGVL